AADRRSGGLTAARVYARHSGASRNPSLARHSSESWTAEAGCRSEHRAAMARRTRGRTAACNPAPCSGSSVLLRAELPLLLRRTGLLFAIAQKVPKKARRRTRCPAAHHARRGVPALLGDGGLG